MKIIFENDFKADSHQSFYLFPALNPVSGPPSTTPFRKTVPVPLLNVPAT